MCLFPTANLGEPKKQFQRRQTKRKQQYDHSRGRCVLYLQKIPDIIRIIRMANLEHLTTASSKKVTLCDFHVGQLPEMAVETRKFLYIWWDGRQYGKFHSSLRLRFTIPFSLRSNMHTFHHGVRCIMRV